MKRLLLFFCITWYQVVHTRGAFKGEGGGGGGGGFFAPPRRAPAPPRIQVSYIFLQSYYEMIKCVQHVHVL